MTAAAYAKAKEAPVIHRGLITVCVMLATIMQALDTTIANVALPYMQGSLGVTLDQVNWVLTSYIVAAAIMTAPSGWLAVRFGRKKVFIIAAAGFTIASLLCGAAQGITDMVAYRLLQGVFGAALVPLSQAVMMDIYPPEKRGQAMAIWGMGVMLGPIMGPTLGGWLTEYYTWRWVFLINLPFGIATVLGLMAYMPDTKPREMRFDWLGFATLSLAIGFLQLMLDRGESQAWFESNEIIIEFLIAAAAGYLFIAHTATAEKPFVPPALFKDWNFTLGVFFMFIVGVLILASVALITPFVQNVMGYPVLDAGFLLGTRGIGTMASMMVVGRLLSFIDARLLIGLGMGCSAFSLWMMTGITPDISSFTIIWTSVLQGIGLGLVFVPLNTISFATLPPQLRTEGASVWTLIRNMGSSIGVSIVIAQLTSGTTLMHARIAELITPFNAGFQLNLVPLLDPSTTEGVAMIDRMATGQAATIAYQNDFLLMTLMGVLCLPLVMLFRGPKKGQAAKPAAAAADAGH
ncbi:MAG: DHA2 family efflux MFS transporter permease subunit [Hyphomicrobiales bacterium]|uniref:DHA2 family efflux MFS transporter permease subunit n=1 Tax=Aestuariivirga sp. TaxID=2650926 RepID=UPI0035B1E91F